MNEATTTLTRTGIKLGPHSNCRATGKHCAKFFGSSRHGLVGRNRYGAALDPPERPLRRFLSRVDTQVATSP